MNNEEKILEILSKMQSQMDDMPSRTDTFTLKTKTEELEENYILLRSVVAALSRDVAELKKAQ